METPDHRERAASLPPSYKAVYLLAANEGVDPAELRPPLNDAIDPTALDALVRSVPDDRDRRTAQVTFSYERYTVQVADNGIVSVTEETEPSGEPIRDEF